MSKYTTRDIEDAIQNYYEAESLINKSNESVSYANYDMKQVDDIINSNFNPKAFNDAFTATATMYALYGADIGKGIQGAVGEEIHGVLGNEVEAANMTTNGYKNSIEHTRDLALAEFSQIENPAAMSDIMKKISYLTDDVGDRETFGKAGNFYQTIAFRQQTEENYSQAATTIAALEYFKETGKSYDHAEAAATFATAFNNDLRSSKDVQDYVLSVKQLIERAEIDNDVKTVIAEAVNKSSTLTIE
jgi:urease gamma subunit